jgi:hypothetical protein
MGSVLPDIHVNGFGDKPDMSTSGLSSLQTEDQRRLLDIIDDIRAFDIDHNIDLPQLVVCGDQSSGKSSVLEAISEIPFPRGENTCTRFVTE